MDATTRSTTATTTPAHTEARPTSRGPSRGPGEAKRRDGVTLAATGRVPHRVRDQVLAEHHLQHTARARTAIIARVHQGTYPLTIPYGYRRRPHTDTDTATSTPQDTGTWLRPWPDHREDDTVRAARTGRARPVLWEPDPVCSHTVRVAASWIRAGVPQAEVAARLATDHNHPYPLTVTGARRPWTARTLLAVLTDPALTGYSVWGRTRHGRPVPHHEWTVSPNPTHPAILPTPLWQTTRRTLTPTLSTTARTVPVSTPPPPADSTIDDDDARP